jgi:uncharacterized protein (DUF4415 family)
LAAIEFRRQPDYSFPNQQITLQLSNEAFERWIATGTGWLARMGKLLRDSC